MNHKYDQIEKKLDALLEGSLPDNEAEKLRTELDKIEQQDILEIRELLARMNYAVPRILPAPQGLRRKLRNIPAGDTKYTPPWRRLATATVALSAITALLVMRNPVTRQPTPEEINQARIELLTAFNYLEKVGQRTGTQVSREVGDAMKHTLLKGVAHGFIYLPENG